MANQLPSRFKDFKLMVLEKCIELENTINNTTTKNVGEDAGEKEPSYTAGGNVS
jgi:hypothetical protein